MNKVGQTTHGLTKTRIYHIWANICQRTGNPKCRDFKNYGGRGISLCKKWRRFEGFHAWSVNNGYKEDLSIDRIDNDSGYSPENCQWIPPAAQARNRRNNNLVTYKGKTQCIAAWSEETGINRATLNDRIFKHKFPLEKAFSKRAGSLTVGQCLEIIGLKKSGVPVKEICERYEIKNSSFYNITSLNYNPVMEL